jgi:hypothetical protein
VSAARDVTEALKPPRTLFVPFRMGHLFGPPRHRTLQRRIIIEALGLVERATESGTIVDLPKSWAEARREATAIERAAGVRE